MTLDIKENCIYIELNDWVYYIDDSTGEQIIEKWKKDDIDSNTKKILDTYV